MSVIFMTVSKIKCQNLEMIDNFLGKHHNNYLKLWNEKYDSHELIGLIL